MSAVCADFRAVSMRSRAVRFRLRLPPAMLHSIWAPNSALLAVLSTQRFFIAHNKQVIIAVDVSS